MAEGGGLEACARDFVEAGTAARRQGGVAAAEALVAARVALYECLIDAGWTPSDEVARVLAFDRLLLGVGDASWYEAEVPAAHSHDEQAC